LLVVNKDQENAHTAAVSFEDSEKGTSGSFAGPVSVTTFGKEQYQWHPGTRADSEGGRPEGKADPDGPAVKSTVSAGPGTKYTLPAASVTVIRGVMKAGSGVK
jgi:hypothetical protein